MRCANCLCLATILFPVFLVTRNALPKRTLPASQALLLELPSWKTLCFAFQESYPWGEPLRLNVLTRASFCLETRHKLDPPLLTLTTDNPRKQGERTTLVEIMPWKAFCRQMAQKASFFFLYTSVWCSDPPLPCCLWPDKVNVRAVGQCNDQLKEGRRFIRIGWKDKSNRS